MKTSGSFNYTKCICFLSILLFTSIFLIIKSDARPFCTINKETSYKNASIVKATGAGTILNDDGATAIASTSSQTNNNTIERSVKISPNPASSILHVDLSGYAGNVTIQLVSMQGKVLKQDEMQAVVLKSMQQQIDVTGITSGTYFLVVIDEKGNRQTEKVIVAH